MAMKLKRWKLMGASELRRANNGEIFVRFISWFGQLHQFSSIFGTVDGWILYIKPTSLVRS